MDKRKRNEWKWKKGRNSAKVIQDRVLRNIFGYRKDEVEADWRRWHTVSISDLYCLLNVTVVIISRGKIVLVCGVDGVGGGHIVVCGGDAGGIEPLDSPRYG